MKTLNLKQGSSEWLAARLEHFTASEASAMLGLSSYMSRSELLQLKKTGIAKEADAATQKRFDKGHAVEALARPVIEAMIDQEFYLVTGSIEIDGLKLLASYDGLTIMEDVVFEHKLFNNNLMNSLENGIIPEQYKPQLEQQLIVSGAEKAIFVCSDGTKKNMLCVDYYPDIELRQRIISGWKQFAKDLEDFEPVQEKAKPEAKPLMELPALSISIMGEVSSSNLEVYKSTALQFIHNINTDLQTDQDFADAEVTIKFCDRAEKELEAVKKQALAQTADIDLLFKAVDQLKKEMRAKRLTLNKLVKSQKEALKIKIVQEAKQAFTSHIYSIERKLNGLYIPNVACDFEGAIKGKRNLSSMHNSIDTELARVKIVANDTFATILQNTGAINDLAKDYKFLFNDLQEICTKNSDDFINLVNSRIAWHKQEEESRLEVEREIIRQEEQRKAEQEAQAKLEAERKQAQEIEAKRLYREKANAIALECAEASKVKEPEQEVKTIVEQSKLVEVEQVAETITISLQEYSQLLTASEFLDALQSAGVDNWSGYSFAQELVAKQQAA